MAIAIVVILIEFAQPVMTGSIDIKQNRYLVFDGNLIHLEVVLESFPWRRKNEE